MRNLEVIESELAEAREALSNAAGTPAEVYSRIVGYYRSVRNWNKGKREEYGERVTFSPGAPLLASCLPDAGRAETAAEEAAGSGAVTAGARRPHAAKRTDAAERVLLFVRPACPACPPAKTAAGNLGIPLELIDAGTSEGLAEAARRSVMSTPTAILLSSTGKELGRARDAEAIGRLRAGMSAPAAV